MTTVREHTRRPPEKPADPFKPVMDARKSYYARKHGVGLVDTDDVIMGGFIVKVPSSIAFESMDEPTFEGFLNNAIRFIASEFGVTPEEVMPDRPQQHRRAS